MVGLVELSAAYFVYIREHKIDLNGQLTDLTRPSMSPVKRLLGDERAEANICA